MNPEESPVPVEICVVCGKDTTGGRGFMTLHLEGHLIAPCCPQCQKVYEETPELFAQRLKNRDTIHKIERGLASHDPE